MAATETFAMLTFRSNLLAVSARRTLPFILVHMQATIAIYSLLRAMPINLLLLQELYPCSMPGNIHMQQTYSFHEATSTYTSHFLVSASLQVATRTNPLRYLFAYCEYTLLGTVGPPLSEHLCATRVTKVFR